MAILFLFGRSIHKRVSVRVGHHSEHKVGYLSGVLTLKGSNITKKLNIPSAIVGLVFGLIATVFLYLFVPPPSTASADSCEGASVYAYNCATADDVQTWCYLMHDNGH